MAHEQKSEADITEAELPTAKTEGSDEDQASLEAAQGEGEAGSEAQDEQLDSLRKELEQVRTKEAEYLEGWQRARAELANARKRFDREQRNTYANAKAGLFSHLLPIVDDFERAFDTLPENLSGEEWLEGIKLVFHKLNRMLEQEGVEPVESVGAQFDPFFHEALTHEPSETVPEGHVIGELQTGYRMGDRVLRPSLVRVSSGLPSEESRDEGAAARGDETTEELADIEESELDDE